MDQPILPFIRQYKRYYQVVAPILEKKRTKTYSTVILFFLVLSLFGWYAVRPTIQTIIYLQREIKDKTDVSRQMDQKVNNLIEAQYLLETQASLIPMISEVVPQFPDPFPLVDHLESLASTANASVSGLQIHTVSLDKLPATQSAQETPENTSEETINPGSEKMEMTISIDGSYVNLSQFVADILSLRRVLHVKTLNFIPSMEKVSSGSAKQKLRMILDVEGYYGLSNITL